MFAKVSNAFSLTPFLKKKKTNMKVQEKTKFTLEILYKVQIFIWQ